MTTKLEVRRQFFHIVFGITLIVLLYFKILNELSLFMLLVFGIFLSIISKRIKIPVVYWFLEKFERKNDLKTFPGKGPIFFLVGALLVVKLFTRDIALASIAILALGDSVSHIYGARYGKIKHPLSLKNKKLIGSLSGIITGFIGALFFVNVIEAFLASFIAMSAEVVELEMNKRTIDDNVIVPLVAGTTIYLLRNYLPRLINYLVNYIPFLGFISHL